MTILEYIGWSSLIWAVLYVCHILLFHKETFFRLNRFYLLGSLVAGLVLPLIRLMPVAEVPEVSYIAYLNSDVWIQSVGEEAVFSISIPFVLTIIYGLGVGLTSFLFARKLWAIYTIFQQRDSIQYLNNTQIVWTTTEHSPFSFFHYIIIPKTLKTETNNLPTILLHETAHVKERHSFDMLFVELLGIVFWFNPLLFLYKKSLRNTHEYFADKTVLKNISIKQYGQLLIEQILPNACPSSLVHAFSQPLLKNRIMMMKQSKSSTLALAKYAFVMPLIAFLMIAMMPTMSHAQKTDKTKTTKSDVMKEVDEMPRFPGCEDKGIKPKKLHNCQEMAMLNYVFENVQYPKAAQKAGIEGTSVARFVVDKEGNVTDVEIVRSIGGGCDEETLRVVKSMPKWIPGKHEGKAVKVQMHLPIRYKLESKAKKDKKGN